MAFFFFFVFPPHFFFFFVENCFLVFSGHLFSASVKNITCCLLSKLGNLNLALGSSWELVE